MNSIEKAIERLLKQTGSSTGAKAKHAVDNTVVNNEFKENSGSRNDRYLQFDFDKLEELGYVIPDQAHSVLAEEFRIIKRPVLRNIAGKGAVEVENGNLVMVSSSLPGEGKTFVTLNLALSIVAEKNTTVLLIDSDVVNPTMSRMLGLNDADGITDVLNGKASIEDVIYQTDVSNLRFIPAGCLDAFSTELLASEKMQQLAQELSERYPDRIILFDSPPLLVTSQAVVLSHVMGQIIVVVAAGGTPQNLVKEALTLLEGDDVVGVVLNKNRSSVLGGYSYGAYHAATSEQ